MSEMRVTKRMTTLKNGAKPGNQSPSHASPARTAPPVLLRGRGNIHTSIAEAIGKSIVQGKFPPGTILPNEAKWAADFKVSRSAVREAIKILMAKNLIVSRPKIGSRVENKERWSLLDHDVLSWYALSPDRAGFLKSLQQFRHIIEPEAAALAAQYRTEAQMDEITSACHDMATAPTLSDRTKADVRFHLAVLKASNNDLLVPMGVIIDSALDNLFVFITREANDLHFAQDLHNNIERNIRLRKVQGARMAVRRLLEHSDDFIRRHLPKKQRDVNRASR
ncbi:FadR/GntR family transcriptional regulator [Nordella sp. HKS 07]|uniref:FadR/GntR family transcriptional regulator n=1 Tax=Nordella sp. HKS 07 TaxID=2712222 RepID=UPI001FEEA615|nr:FadR/GntR family transcriptional regulator [Nordella sp. HKS 07]